MNQNVGMRTGLSPNTIMGNLYLTGSGAAALWYCWLDDVWRTHGCGGDEPAVDGAELDFASPQVQ